MLNNQHRDCIRNGQIHLLAEGLDKGPDGVGTGSSIPVSRAFDPDAMVMLGPLIFIDASSFYFYIVFVVYSDII